MQAMLQSPFLSEKTSTEWSKDDRAIGYGGLELLGKRADLGLSQMHEIYVSKAHTVRVCPGAQNDLWIFG